MRPLDVAAALARATQEMREPQDLDATLETIVRVARESIQDIDFVGITVARRDGAVETLAASDPEVLQLDQAQYAAGEGPCLHAIDAEPVVRVENARDEQRWPAFIARAVPMGLRSQLGVRLHADEHTLGALNLYSYSSDTISEETVQLAELFAAHAGLALGQARRIENLSTALASRKVIGMALGMLMQRLDIDEDTAFAYLTRISASSQTKLRDVAASIVDQHRTRLLPPARPGPRSEQRPEQPADPHTDPPVHP